MLMFASPWGRVKNGGVPQSNEATAPVAGFLPPLPPGPCLVEPPDGSGPLRLLLRETLLDLPYPAFVRLICLLMEHMGYTDVCMAGRTSRKGRNRQGGYDIQAVLPDNGPSAPGRPVIVQVKQYGPHLALYQRSVDELRGVCLRVGAAQALLVTTSMFSPLIHKDRLARASIAPVRLIDSKDLAGLLIRHGIGVKQTDGRLALDPSFFAELCYAGGAGDGRGAGRAAAPLPGPAPQQKPSRRMPGLRWQVSVTVEAPSGGTDTDSDSCSSMKRAGREAR